MGRRIYHKRKKQHWRKPAIGEPQPLCRVFHPDRTRSGDLRTDHGALFRRRFRDSFGRGALRLGSERGHRAAEPAGRRLLPPVDVRVAERSAATTAFQTGFGHGHSATDGQITAK